MMRSLYSGVAGLRTHQIKMDVIGNNIANVNTTAYKSQSVTFRDLMYQTTQSASGANAETGLGGTNAKQIGLGVTTGAINTAISQQGSAQTTNNGFDIMITGDAFFVVSNGSENFFTRDGSFYVDGQGNLAMTSTGYNVMGWQVDPATGEPKPDTVTALQIMNETNMTYPPEATSEARVGGIIDKNDKKVNSAAGRIMNLDFYDDMGYKYTAKMSIHSTSTDGGYYVALDDILDSNGKSVGPDVLDRVTFGDPRLTVDVSVDYRPVNGDVVTAGSLVITDGATPAVTINVPAIDTPAVPDAAMLTSINTLYGVDLNTTPPIAGLKVAFDKNGVMKITADDPLPAGIESSYRKVAGTTSTFTATGVTVTDKNDPAITHTFTPGPGTPGADDAIIKQLYGLDIAAEGVLAYQINEDGTLNVTRKTVKNAANLVYNTGNGDFASVNGNGQGTMTLGFGGITKFKDINIDFSKSLNVNNNGSCTVGATSGKEGGLGAGRKTGDLIDIAVGKGGLITASYDNGMSRCLGQIATAAFANPSGLEKQGDNLYSATMNSGDFDGVGKDITADGGGSMQAGVLEMSNVDLSAEFTEMITTQRGFQANSRIITVSDTMLEELTNLKR